jgi:5-oxoprolinase (ATP-hydrolysing)
MALADVVREMTEPAAFTLTGNRDNAKISSRMTELVKKAEQDLSSQGFPADRIQSETYLNCRYHGSSTQLMIEKPEDGDYENKFFDDHKREFGFNLSGRDILVDDIRVRAVGKSLSREVRSPYKDFEETEKRKYDESKFEDKQVYFDGGKGWMKTKVVPLKDLRDGDQVRVSGSWQEWIVAGSRMRKPADENQGPAIIFDNTQTILVEPTHLVSCPADSVSPSEVRVNR